MENNQKQNNDQQSEAGGPRFPFRGLAMWFILLAFALFLYLIFSSNNTEYAPIAYNPDFVTYVEEGKVRKCEIIQDASGTQKIRGELIEQDKATGRPKQFEVFLHVTDSVPLWLIEKDVNFEYKKSNPYFLHIMTSAVPFIIVLALLYFLFVRQMRIAGKGAMNFGKSRAKMLTRDKNKITFDLVAGVDEAKEEVQEIIEFLRDPKKFQKLGGRIPKGVLLVGPPGTGKTLLAKAIAGEAEVPFFSISGSDFVEMFVGVGASRVRDMFEQGKKNAPCIIFIDEIDAVGRSRFSGIGGGHDEREQTLNALLVEMDGFDTQEGVIIVAATNRPDVLDPALLRPGRFDRQISIDLPALEGRAKILGIHAKKVILHDDVDLHRVARGTPGFSGADLANLINEAALLAARRGADSIVLADLEEARDKVRWGRERRSRMLDENEKKLTAYHEAGHALVMQCEKGNEPLHKVTIIPRGQSLGSTMQLPEKDRYTESHNKLKAMLVGFMGGRAAEEIVFGDVTTGASNDLKQATRIARAMICEWGMSENLGPQTFGQREEHLFLGREVAKSNDISDETAKKIDAEVTNILNTSYARAMQILTENRSKLDDLANRLLDLETIEGADVEDLVNLGHFRERDETPKEPFPEDREPVPEVKDKKKADEPGFSGGITPPEPGASVA